MADRPAIALGATPGKLAMVAVLAAILAAVVWTQLGAGAVLAPSGTSRLDDPNGAARSRRVPRPTAVEPAVAPAESAGRKSAQKSRPTFRIDLEETLAIDLFAVPPRLIAARAAASPDAAEAGRQALEQARQRELALNAIRSGGVQMIFDDGHEKKAVLGNRVLRVGDTVEGLRISNISLQGIMLSEQPAGQE